MKRHVAALAAAAALMGCNSSPPEPPEPAVTVEDAVVTVPAVPGGMGAAYFTLKTNKDPSRLLAVASPSAQAIELHETREEGGRSQMQPLAEDRRMFGPGEPLRFAPGGKHAMLAGMDPAIRPGGKITLRFEVEPLRAPVSVEADVRGPGQAHSAH